MALLDGFFGSVLQSNATPFSFKMGHGSEKTRIERIGTDKSFVPALIWAILWIK